MGPVVAGTGPLDWRVVRELLEIVRLTVAVSVEKKQVVVACDSSMSAAPCASERAGYSASTLNCATAARFV